MKRILLSWVSSVLCIAVLLTLLGLYVLSRPSLRVIQTWAQPSSIQYPDGAIHYLSVVESDRDWRGFPFHLSRRYIVYVGLESGTPSHGHAIDFSFYPGNANPAEDLRTVIQQSNVKWSLEGVTLQTISGHQLFIPAQLFMGGR